MNKLFIFAMFTIFTANCSNQASSSNQVQTSEQILESAIQSGNVKLVERALRSRGLDLKATLEYNDKPVTFLYLVALQTRFNPEVFEAIASRLSLADLQQQLSYSPGEGWMTINDLLKNDRAAQALIKRLLQGENR